MTLQLTFSQNYNTGTYGVEDVFERILGRKRIEYRVAYSKIIDHTSYNDIYQHSIHQHGKFHGGRARVWCDYFYGSIQDYKNYHIDDQWFDKRLTAHIILYGNENIVFPHNGTRQIEHDNQVLFNPNDCTSAKETNLTFENLCKDKRKLNGKCVIM